MTTVFEKILPKIYETKLRYVILMHGTLVPKLTIGPILTLSVKKRIPAHIRSKIKTSF